MKKVLLISACTSFFQSVPTTNNLSCRLVNMFDQNGSELYSAPFPNTISLAILSGMTSKINFVGLGIDRLAQFKQQLASFS